jgi:hypothetical protein
MKKIILVLIFPFMLTLSASTCERTECCLPPQCSETPTLTGTWKLEAYQSLSTGILESKPADADKDVIFTFKDDEKMGTIVGKTFVNTIQGSYELSENCRIKVTTFGGSKVGEPAWSKKAWLISEQEYHYEKNEDQLKIHRNPDMETMIFKKM